MTTSCVLRVGNSSYGCYHAPFIHPEGNFRYQRQRASILDIWFSFIPFFPTKRAHYPLWNRYCPSPQQVDSQIIVAAEDGSRAVIHIKCVIERADLAKESYRTSSGGCSWSSIQSGRLRMIFIRVYLSLSQPNLESLNRLPQFRRWELSASSVFRALLTLETPLLSKSVKSKVLRKSRISCCSKSRVWFAHFFDCDFSAPTSI